MYCILIDKYGFKLRFDLLVMTDKKDLNDGESIIEQNWQIANGMNKPRWNGVEWIDTDPLPPVEEIPPQPSESDKISILKGQCKELETQVKVLKDEFVSINQYITHLELENITVNQQVTELELFVLENMATK